MILGCFFLCWIFDVLNIILTELNFASVLKKEKSIHVYKKKYIFKYQRGLFLFFFTGNYK